MMGGYYITNFDELSQHRGLFSAAPRYVFNGDGSLLAALWFRDGYNKGIWDADHAEIPATDTRVVAAVTAYPAMKM